ncbi:LuxR C-terminal-related transcriptional regulator [Streptomyces sp. NPDC046887]|uniref:ATP-binding protein n=1 Tax=Streptomyces sp. NPDC046887 TaxID=3155472 RepID=UPI0033F104E0
MERRSFGAGCGAEPAGMRRGGGAANARLAGGSAGGGGFVGRAGEVRWLREVLRAGPCVVVVRGEAGSGVSRLVDEVLEGREGADGFAGWTQLRAVCPDGVDPVPFGPVADALAALPYREGEPGEGLPAVTGVVGLVVPELAGRLPEPPASAADPEVRRALLPRAVRALLAAQGDTVLVVEDVHRADAATLDLLHHLFAALPPRLRVVVTECAAPGLPLLGLRVPRQAQLVEVDVRPWTAEETGEFVRRWARERGLGESGDGIGEGEGQGEVGELAELVHGRAGGLPGAVEALLREAEDIRAEGEGSGTDTGAVLEAVRAGGVPLRLRRELALRYGRLTEDARRLVQAAAVLDRAVPVAVLGEVAGIGPERAEEAAHLAVRGSVLRADGPYPVFRHPLDRQAAYEEVPGPRLAWLSLRAARALHRAGDGPLPLAELARLYRAGGRVREGLRCLVAAGDRAAAEGDYATATLLYTQVVEEDPRPEGRIRAAAKLARTAQLARAGEPVVEAVRRVLDQDDPPPRLRGEIRLHLSVVLRNQSGGALDSLNEVALAIPDLELSDPQTAARAMVVAAIPSIKGWPITRHQAWLERAEAFADRVTDPVARAAIAANRATALMLLGDRRAWAAADALRAPAGSAMEAAHFARGWTNLAHAAVALGYADRARSYLDRASAGLADSSSPYLEGLTETARLVIDWHAGRWERLHQDADRTTRLYQEIPDLTSEAMLVRGLTALHVLGDVPRARRDLLTAARTTRYDTGVILTASAAALARVHLEAGRPGQASEAVEEVLRRLERTGGWVWGGELVPTAVEALCASGQGERAHRLVADFAAGTADRDAPADQAALTVARALLAEAEGRYGEAAALLTEAEREWRRLARPFDAARAAEARGRCLLDADSGEGTGGEDAVEVIREVVETYRELGARWDVARCQRLLRRHDVVTTHRRGRLGYGDRLSPREQEVARLVAQGRANRDIAESLVLSTRTVEHHVARIMRKLSVGSRTDIAAAHARSGPGE